MRCCMGKLFCFMKSEITVSQNCHFLIAVKERIAYCAVADAFSLEFFYAGNGNTFPRRAGRDYNGGGDKLSSEHDTV